MTTVHLYFGDAFVKRMVVDTKRPPPHVDIHMKRPPYLGPPSESAGPCAPKTHTARFIYHRRADFDPWAYDYYFDVSQLKG